MVLMKSRFPAVFAAFFLVLLLLCAPFPACSADPGGGVQQAYSIGEAFAGEELAYDIGFWFFNGVAESRLVLKEDGPGRYVATLSAKTNGVLDSFLKHRRDKYIARLRVSPDGKRFLTESFEKEVSIDGKGTRRSVHKVDYEARTVVSRSWGGGKPEKSTNDPIPDGMFMDDPLAAFYNFRFGVYGGIEEGRDYRITTFPKEDKIPEIKIRIAPEKELRRRARRSVEADILADAKIDKELFGSKTGDIEILFTRDMLPVQAIARGIILFGDVKGHLREVVAGAAMRKSLDLPSVSSNP